MGTPELRYVFGIDAFQALQLSLDYIAIRMAAAVPRPFLFEREDRGCFTRSLPTYLPAATQKRLQMLIDKAGDRWARKQKRSARDRKTGR
jgi:hypothetical protein